MPERKMPPLSEDARKDPASTKKLTDECVRQIKEPYNAYKEKIIRLVKGTNLELPEPQAEKLQKAVPIVIDYQVFQKAVQKAGEEFMDDLGGIVPKVVKMAYSQGAAYGDLQLHAIGIPTAKTISKTEKPLISILVQRSLNEYSGFTAATSKIVNREVLAGIVNGAGSYEMAEHLIVALNKSFASAERIARTESMYALNNGTIVRFRRNGIEKVERIGHYDDRICDECAAADGEIYSIEEAAGILPAHPMCRCTWRPVITWDED